MAWNWINPEEYSFNSFLLLERFQICKMIDAEGWLKNKNKWRRSMGIALTANPAVLWYLQKRCPERAAAIAELAAAAPVVKTAEQIKRAEEYALLSVEDFAIYTTPERMFEKCWFIYAWNKERLFELVDFTGKTVLDVGAGSGRLTFAAAEKAAWVYASEPVGTLREFIRLKIANEGFQNVRVLDGLITELPYPNDTFDIVMSGHVVGDEWEKEIKELARVCKNGGWLIDCRGDGRGDQPSPELVSRGWEEVSYIGYFGEPMYNHRKQVWKR